MKKELLFVALFATCSAISNLALANTPEYTIKSWQIGIIDRPSGAFGMSPSTKDPDFSNPVLSLTLDGKVGIGTSEPLQDLHIVGGNIMISKTSTKTRADGSNNGSILFGADVNNKDKNSRRGSWGIEYVSTDSEGYGLNFWKVGGFNYALFLQNNGNIGIGTKSPAYKLDVIGTIRAREILVDLNGVGGADFVFDTDYRLRPLSEVQSFIAENKHLPEIQSAKDMQQNGVSVNELQFQLLQKIEELTLYIIDQDRQIKDLQQKVEQLQK